MNVSWSRSCCLHQNLHWNELFLCVITTLALMIILENVKKHTLNPDLEKYIKVLSHAIEGSALGIIGNICTNTKNQIIYNKCFPLLWQRIESIGLI